MDFQARYQYWLDYEALDANLRYQLEKMDEAERKEAFGADLSFGTAGMRGIIGPGTNRMNSYTVRQATEGLAQLILEAGPEAKERGVAIAYDSRHYSPEFALDAARVLGYHGIKTYLFTSLRPTPELSFTVRHLGCEAGIMITASHNPAEYNGYKVYGSDGGQMPPEDAAVVTQKIRAVEDPFQLALADADELREKGLLIDINDDVDEAYLAEIATVNINPELIHEMADDVHLVFAPLHGTGYYIGMKALTRAGFKHIHVVEEQAQPDGDFPTVQVPNPEYPDVYDMALVIGERVQADILLSTDPDADRLGAMIRKSDGSYQRLSGNQIAAVMLDYIIQARIDQDDFPENGVAVKSFVSTKLADKMMESYGREVVEVPTGFKFIAEKIHEYEQTHAHSFLMGFEESYGYLIKPFVRDKDAIQALVLLSEIAAYHKRAGRTLGDAVELMYEKYGYFVERTIALKYPGLEGKAKMDAIMKDVRGQQLTQLGDFKVDLYKDYLSGVARHADGSEEKMDYPSLDALKFDLEDGSWVAVRPSGTEPLIKLYLGVEAPSAQAAEEKADALEAVMRQLTE